MEKVAKILGVDKDTKEVVKNVVLLLLTAISVSFTAGSYFGKAKDIPQQIATMCIKQDTIERRQDNMEVKMDTQVAAILEAVKNQGNDIREMRSVLMSRKSGQ